MDYDSLMRKQLNPDSEIFGDQGVAGAPLPPEPMPMAPKNLGPGGIDFEDLRKQSDAANEKRGMMQVLGGAFQDAASVPTAYQLLKSGKSTAPDIKSGFDAVAKNIQDPWEKQKQTYEMYKQASDNQKDKREGAYQEALANNDSPQTKALKMFAIQNGMPRDQVAQMSGFDVLKFMDPKSLGEIKAKAAVDFGNQMKLKQFENQLDMQKMGFQKAITPATPEELKSAGAGQIGQKAADEISKLKQEEYPGNDMEARWNNIGIPKFWGEKGEDLVSLPSFLKTDAGKNFHGSANAFLDSVVSHRTAKGMPPERREQLAEVFIPKPGDTDAEVKAKSERRNQALAEMRAMAGPKAWASVNANAGTNLAGPAVLPNQIRIPGVNDFSGPSQNANAGAVDPKIMKYAQEHQLDYGSAEKILRGRGYGKK